VTDRPTAEPTADGPLALVREGWRHLQLQRPLAAWACWQRALRLAPDDPAAARALATLAVAPELPAVARAAYRFRNPEDPGRRARWDARLRAGRFGPDDLDDAASAFAGLAADDPADIDAWLNLALCQAWLGRNAEAVDALDRVVRLCAVDRPDRASDAWTLAEVLRQGTGAEALADDCRYAWLVDRPAPPGLADRWPGLHPVRLPDLAVAARRPDVERVFEWLDRPLHGPGDDPPARAAGLPRVLATVIVGPGLMRVSSPDPSAFAALGEPRYAEVALALRDARREKGPLPIAWADAALATFRYPPGLGPRARDDLARGAVEHHFENVWPHQPRQALGGRTPMAAGAASAAGDLDARSRLSAVVRYREQLGARPTHAAVYQGYPFDRLRRRLGLDPTDPTAVDPDDLSCAGGAELDAVDPATADPVRLADAFASALGLRDDARTARFAAVILGRGDLGPSALDPASVVAPLVREALRLDDAGAALEILRRARSLCDGRDAATLTVWSAEVLARAGRPGDALDAYLGLLEPGGDPQSQAGLALDGTETLLDHEYPDHALSLLDAASAEGWPDPAAKRRAASLRDRAGR